MRIFLSFLLFILTFFDSGKCANILGVFGYPSYSHQIIFHEICKELSLRGHQVTILTTNPFEDPLLTNLTEVNISFVYDVLRESSVQKLYSKNVNPYNKLKNAQQIVDTASERLLSSTQFKNLISDGKNFDLVLIQIFQPVMYALGHILKAPVISISTTSMSNVWYDYIGNPDHPVLNPDVYLNFPSGQMTLWQKCQCLAYYLWSKYYYWSVVLTRVDQMAKKYFGDVPAIERLQKNVSLTFLNRNLLEVRANVPGAVDISFIHVKPPKPLPKDLKKILDEAITGVIFFSLGTNVKSTRCDEKLQVEILKALSDLPYTVLCKWDSDHFPSKSRNVIFRKWFPQGDVLAHPNVKVFVTQGGLQSVQESVSRGVPLVGIPFQLDQPRIVRRVVELGIGEGIDAKGLTRNTLKETIIRVAEQKSYKRRIEEVRRISLDTPMNGLENAIWWTEYVIRHKGAKHLRSLAVDMSWFHYLLMDVWLFLIAITFCSIFLAYILLRITRRKNQNKKIKED